MAAAIEMKGVKKRYGPIDALVGLDLAVPQGSIFGLIGPNGAGKTTTFGICCGYLSHDSGEARVLGLPPRPFAPLKGRVGALPQDAQLPRDEKLLDALTFYGRLAGRATGQALAEARASLEAVGLGGELLRRCGALSHGQVKRAAIAQAFLGTPALVLLDEPTAGLDPKAAHQIREIIVALGRGDPSRTVVVSSHNLGEIERLCSDAALIDKGRVVASGAMEALRGADAEITVGLSEGPVPLEAVQAAPGVKGASWDAARRELTVRFDARSATAEDVIAVTLPVLFANGARVASVQKGKRLEERVLAMTSGAA
jgi:ABC-type multidrug transport system ATPase subunit